MSYIKNDSMKDDSDNNQNNFNISRDLKTYAINQYKSKMDAITQYKPKSAKYYNQNPKSKPNADNIVPGNKLFADMLNKDILVVLDAVQLNILGQVFRPIFTGRVTEVTNGTITLDPVIIKMNTAPFFKFPTPLSFPMESIAYFTPFDPETPIPIS